MEEVEARNDPHALPADDEMIERALPGCAAAMLCVRRVAPGDKTARPRD
ncbi:MAG TPA: hypothetical protein VFU88_17575 [Ktedonobacterales bacterium]|nr:hypothetical protein [Ktedonobacterales bacterium]